MHDSSMISLALHRVGVLAAMHRASPHGLIQRPTCLWGGPVAKSESGDQEPILDVRDHVADAQRLLQRGL